MMRDWSQWPSMAQYLDWARAQGCQVACAETVSGANVYQLARITAPSGRSVSEVFIQESDPLMSTTVARLDRRLGLKSAFFV